jgi:ADP-heptose:LPS heptosyltransferase
MKERGNALLRWADRYLGIPLVLMLGLFKKKRTWEGAPRKVGVLLTAGIGDTVLFSSILQDLKDCEITLFTGAGNGAMAELLPGIRVVRLPITAPFKALKIIRRESFDLWLDGNPWPRLNALLSHFARARFKVGFNTPNQYRHLVYDLAVIHQKNIHELENYRNLIRPLGFNPIHLPKVEAPEQKKEAYVVMHLFAGGSRAHLKEWPQEKWRELIRHFPHHRIFLTGSKEDAPRLASLGAEVVAGKLSLKETAALLKKASLVISVDTGIMHLAAAVGAPVVALHGPTSPARWGAIGPHVIAIQPDKDYEPCIHLGFESLCKESRCMRSISVAQVLELAKMFVK